VLNVTLERVHAHGYPRETDSHQRDPTAEVVVDNLKLSTLAGSDRRLE